MAKDNNTHSQKTIVIAPKLGTVITVSTRVERTSDVVRTTQQSQRETFGSSR